MDVAKYIGLFLQKNQFCYIHGLGNLELRKKPASFDGQNLQSPQYTVVLTPTGSIDDSLANFIATNEQTSISKAANELREFSIRSRADLAAGKEVVIPGTGKFTSANGKIEFITDLQLIQAPPPVTIKQQPVKKAEELASPAKTSEPVKEKAHKSTTVNWGKILIWVLILGLVATAVVLGIGLISNKDTDSTNVADTAHATVVPPDTTQLAPPVQDTLLNRPDSTGMRPQDSTAATAPVTGTMNYRVIIGAYDNLPRAVKRQKQLTSFGHSVELATKDSANYFVVMPITGNTADTTRVLDSLRKKFNPKGVSIYH